MEPVVRSRLGTLRGRSGLGVPAVQQVRSDGRAAADLGLRRSQPTGRRSIVSTRLIFAPAGIADASSVSDAGAHDPFACVGGTRTSNTVKRTPWSLLARRERGGGRQRRLPGREHAWGRGRWFRASTSRSVKVDPRDARGYCRKLVWLIATIAVSAGMAAVNRALTSHSFGRVAIFWAGFVLYALYFWRGLHSSWPAARTGATSYPLPWLRASAG
jgi:hypothetical protein